MSITSRRHRVLTFCVAAATCLSASHVAAQAPLAGVAEALGRTGADQPGGVVRFGFPRSDLTVVVDGLTLKPALALGSWVAFRDMGDGAEVMGDLVLTHSEVNPVLSRLLENGLTITALHNHLLRSSPATMYMHIHGHGDAAALAAAIRGALQASATPLAPPAPPQAQPALALDTAALDRALGAKGQANGGVYQFSIRRADQVTENGQPVPPSLGLAIAINVQPTTGGRAVATGDFVLLGSEVAPVLRALRDHGIEVTALHNHMIDEQPRLFFMHFWGNDDAARLAAGLAAALAHVNVAR